MITIPKDFTSELNTAQRQAVENPLYSCTKIVAGAGTGKTKIISKRFVKLVFDLISENAYTPTSRILVITFTDKAAKEMKTRIIKELDANNLNSYGDELWISTFHGFCNKFLRTHCIEANLSPEFNLGEAQELKQIYDNIIKTLKYNEYKTISNIDEICERLKLNPEILDAENLKTLGEISNIDKLFENIFNIIKKIKSLGLTPEEFLTKTKTSNTEYSKTIKELTFNKMEPEDYISDWGYTLKKYLADGFSFDNNCFTEIAKKKRIIDKNNKRKAELWTPAMDFPESVDAISEYENNLTDIVSLLYAIYQNELEKEDIIDFDDLINKTVFILKTNSELRKHYQEYFKHLVIDEFQDTNGAQLELIKLLLNEEKANITFVGDRKQSIYGFRYAQMENLEVLHKFIEEKYGINYPEIKLEINYRSNANILDAVNHITTSRLMLDEPLTPSDVHKENNPEKYVKNSKICGAESPYEVIKAESAFIADEITKLKAKDNAQFKDFAILIKNHSQAEPLERTLSKAGIPVIKKTNTDFFMHPIIKNSIAILRLLKNPIDDHALARLLKTNLSNRELYDLKKEIEDILHQEGLNDTEKKLNLCEKTLKLYEANKLENKELKNIYDSILQATKDKKDKSILQIFIQLSNKINLHNPTTEIDKFQSEHNLKRFEKLLYDYEQNRNYTSLSNFIEYFDKIKENKDFELPTVLSSDLDAVQILTIHASKGLEFPYVFVLGITAKEKPDREIIKLDLQYGKKPGFGLLLTKLHEAESPKTLVYKHIWQNPRKQAENLRLFYVAASRAEKYLNILTFEEMPHLKPAEYTTDFPSFVTTEQINMNEIPTHEAEFAKLEMQQEHTIIPNVLSTESNKEKLHSFSFSKLNTFTSCPQKFLLKYQYFFPSQTFAKKATETGSIIHKLIYNSFLLEKELIEQEISEILPPEISDFEKSRILSLYSCFVHSKYSPTSLKNKTIYSEKSFEFLYKLNNSNVEFVGDIDLLIENEDKTYTIIDFKTNTNLEHSINEYQRQLYLYKQALENAGYKIKTSMMVGLSENGTIEEIELTNDAKVKEGFDEALLGAIDCLENPTENMKKDEEYCRTCGYNYLCKVLN